MKKKNVQTQFWRTIRWLLTLFTGKGIDFAAELGGKIEAVKLGTTSSTINTGKSLDVNTELSEVFFGLQGLTSRMNEVKFTHAIL